MKPQIFVFKVLIIEKIKRVNNQQVSMGSNPQVFKEIKGLKQQPLLFKTKRK